MVGYVELDIAGMKALALAATAGLRCQLETNQIRSSFKGAFHAVQLVEPHHFKVP
jgi:hypothetical protein